MRVSATLFRFAVVGLVSNAAIYLMYLVITWAGVGPKLAMTGLYVVGVVQTFYFNRSWAFGHTGKMSLALLRYFWAYALGYMLNFAGLALLVDRWAWSHQWVQGGLILVVALFLFAVQRYWVFPEETRGMGN